MEMQKSGKMPNAPNKNFSQQKPNNNMPDVDEID